MMKKPLVSFIVPVYNAEQYLVCCLDSLVGQTVKDIEIICINDCSPDGSKAILEKYAQQDSRISCIDFTTNKGPGAARNAGIEKATGTYLRMVDPDDFIPHDSTEKLLDAAEKYKSDIVQGGFCNCTVDGKKKDKGSNYPEKLYCNVSIRNERVLRHIGIHWVFLFKAELIKKNNILYNETMRNYEDVAFLVRLAPYMENVTLIPKTVYFYRRHPVSTTRRKRTKNYYENIFAVYEMVYEIFTREGRREIADNFLIHRLCKHIPCNVLFSIPDNVDKAESMDILGKVGEFFRRHDIKNLCLANPYDWRHEYELPVLMKHLVILMSEKYLDEAYETLVDVNIKKAEKKEFKQKTKELSRNRKELQQKNKELFQKWKGLKKNNKELTSSRKEFEKKYKLCAQQQRKCQKKLYALYNSTSWRITEPLRKISTLLR